MEVYDDDSGFFLRLKTSPTFFHNKTKVSCTVQVSFVKSSSLIKKEIVSSSFLKVSKPNLLQCEQMPKIPFTASGIMKPYRALDVCNLVCQKK